MTPVIQMPNAALSMDERMKEGALWYEAMNARVNELLTLNGKGGDWLAANAHHPKRDEIMRKMGRNEAEAIRINGWMSFIIAMHNLYDTGILAILVWDNIPVGNKMKTVIIGELASESMSESEIDHASRMFLPEEYARFHLAWDESREQVDIEDIRL